MAKKIRSKCKICKNCGRIEKEHIVGYCHYLKSDTFEPTERQAQKKKQEGM